MRTALIPKFIPPFKGGVAPDTLLNDLESYWTLDELSGVRADSVGSNDLSDINTVIYVNDGPRGVNAKFVAASAEYLDAGTPVVPTGADTSFTVEGWYKASINNAGIVAQWNDVGPHYNFLVAQGVSGAGVLDFYVGNAAGVGVNINRPSTLDEWHHFVAWYDSVADESHLTVDDGAIATGVIVGGRNVLMSADLWIGQNAPGTRALTGLVGRVGVWTRAISALERTELYNSGRGKSYADLSAGIKTNLVSYWNLDEVSNGAGPVTRVDSEGANDLTDNNTVTSINTGPEQVVAKFNSAIPEWLSCPYDVSIASNAITYAIWFKTTGSGAGFANIMGFDDPAGTPPLDFWINGSVLTTRFTTTDLTSQTISVPIGIEDDKWHLGICWFDPTDRIGRLTLDNNDSAATAAFAQNTLRDPSALTFKFGNWTFGAYKDLSCRAGIWSRVLTPAERTELFNSGVGKKYSELSAGIQTNLQRYYDLTESSGNRDNFDFDPAKQLTDNNTVLSVINMPDVAEKICAKFDGTIPEYLQRINVVLPNEFTISCWFRFSDTSPVSGAIFSCIGAWPNSVQVVAYLGSSNLIYALVGDGVAFDYSTAIAAGGVDFIGSGWHHLAVWFGADLKIHLSVDNIPEFGSNLGTVQTGVYRVPSPLFFGNGVPGSFYGISDEFALWSRVLTPAERARLFNLGKGYFYPFVP